MFLFEERIGTLRRRAQQLGMALDKHMSSGRIRVQQIDPAELAPDEFVQLVRDSVEQHGSRLVVIDSINGLYTAMPEARSLTLQLHEMLSFLSERGAATILTMAQTGLVGSLSSPIDVSYLTDTIFLLRYFEAAGRVRKAISIVKKRSGRHEDTIRALELGPRGIELGPPLAGMRGVLGNDPTIHAPEPSKA
jgi:circadian clock protein KaiC